MSALLLDYNVAENIGNRFHGYEPILCMRIQTDLKLKPGSINIELQTFIDVE